MPSESSRRRKDDTWTSDELNKALKVPKDEMHRRRKNDDDGDRRSHKEDSDRRKHRNDEGRSHRRDDEKRHSKRSDSPELTEEDRERLRRERREKREGGKEEKKSRPKENKAEVIKIDDDDDRKRRHRRQDEEHGSERRRHRDENEDDDERRRRHKKREEESDRKRHRDDDERKHRDNGSTKHHRDEDSKRDRDDERRRHHDEDRERRHRDGDRERRRPKGEEESSRRHRGDEKDQHHKSEESRSHRRRQNEEEDRTKSKRHGDEDEDDEERERRRQERRERKERDKRKEADEEKESKKVSEKEDRHKSSRSEREDRHDRHKSKDEKSERKVSKQEAGPPVISLASNGRVLEQQTNDGDGDDDDNYEEDFEDYEDDFEDDEDPEMKEEGEMEEVLRALDEENNRLQLDSRRSNWSDSTELSDERFKENREEEERKSRAAQRGKTFINFVSAKQRVMNETVASRARKRFDDLSKLIELDVAKYDMFDLPPVKEYELYIRSFGRSDTRQAYVQTHDDDIERDVQTDEIESLSKWTQHPPDQEEAVGGEGITVASMDDSKSIASKADPERLALFLDKVGQFLFTILDEESNEGLESKDQRNSEPKASFSQASWHLGNLDFLEGRRITHLSFCPSDPNSLLSVHSLPYYKQARRGDLYEMPPSPSVPTPDEQFKIDSLHFVCVWNLSQPGYPYRICASQMKINCACFSPTKASLVFSGMEDGSMTLWDLREPASQHKALNFKDRSHLVRFPTYMTAGVLETDNHTSPVVSMAPVYSNIVGSMKDEETAESKSGLSFQLASVEEKAVVNLWVVAEIATPDLAGSPNDLGLSPGGKIKLLKSSSISLHNPNKFLSTSSDLQALSLILNPGDLNHFYVPTDSGCVLHGVRFGNRVFPPAHSSMIDSPIPVVSIDFSPFGHPYFLAACKDGTLHLYNTRIEHPISSWRHFITGESIISVRWSHSRPAVFFVLDNNSTMFTFDLVENGLSPMKTDVIRTADANFLEVGSDPNLLTSGVGPSRPAHIVLALENGTIECIAVTDAMREQQPLEEEFLASYSDRY